MTITSLAVVLDKWCGILTIDVTSNGTLGVGACASLDFQQFISFSFWSYTNCDSNFLYEISSGFCIPQLLTFGSFSGVFFEKMKRAYQIFCNTVYART